MYTYSIQSYRTQTGDNYVIEWDGDEIHGMCGPLTTAETEQAIRDIKDAGSFEYDYEVGGRGDDLGFPLATYDPNTGEVYRA